MNTTTQETLAKLMALREEGERLAALYARPILLVHPSANIRDMMDLAACKIKQNASEYVALRATLPIQ